MGGFLQMMVLLHLVNLTFCQITKSVGAKLSLPIRACLVMVVGTRNLELGTRSWELGAGNQELGTRSWELGAGN